jgi:hypothetical protein
MEAVVRRLDQIAFFPPQFLQFEFMRKTQLSDLAVDLNGLTQGECA